MIEDLHLVFPNPFRISVSTFLSKLSTERCFSAQYNKNCLRSRSTQEQFYSFQVLNIEIQVCILQTYENDSDTVVRENALFFKQNLFFTFFFILSYLF